MRLFGIAVGDIYKELESNAKYVIIHIDICDKAPILIMFSNGSLWQTNFDKVQSDTFLVNFDNAVEAIRSNTFLKD